MTGTTDVVDAAVVMVAAHNNAVILTSDADDIRRLVTASGREVAVVAV
jgi:predicted nuclease of predicted toxin-antitoxin system